MRTIFAVLKYDTDVGQDVVDTIIQERFLESTIVPTRHPNYKNENNKVHF
jgi:hypothetical protein